MHSVCKENNRLEQLSAPVIARSEVRPPLRSGKARSRQRCSCKSNPNGRDPETLFKSTDFKMTLNSKWMFTKFMFIFEIESMSHHYSCPLFPKAANTTKAKFRLTSCGTLLARAIEASISIKRGAGGSSISPVLQGAYVVHDKATFRVLDLYKPEYYHMMLYAPDGGRRRLEALLDSRIHELQRLFGTGKASPYDVDLEGNTLLHVRVTLSSIGSH